VFALVQCHGQYGELILQALLQPQFIISVLYLSVVSSVTAFICLNYGAVRVSVSEASIFANLTTVISIVAGVVFLREPFSWAALGFTALILLGIWGVQRSSKNA
jgi:drug/metabolite transporter (DMT)-like permease